MWRSAVPDWLYLDYAKARGLIIKRGRCGVATSEAHHAIPAAIWTPVWSRYVAASNAVAATPYLSFVGDGVAEVEEAQQRLRGACTAIYDLLATTIGADLGSDRFVVVRSPSLQSLTLARLVAVAAPALLRARRLPWDLPTSYPEAAAPVLAHAVTSWTLPAMADLTIIAPEQLELDRLFPARLSDVTGVGHAAAVVARWQLELEHALRAARAAGAEVIRPATSRNFLAALQGRHRACIQLVGHVDRRSLYVDDGPISLARLAELVNAAVADGWQSPVKAMDLSTCGSELLFGVLQRAGIEYISGRFAPVHLGEMAGWLRCLHAGALLDGATPIAHAWLLAALT